MPRSVNHVASRAKRKRILKLTRGYFGARKNVWTVAKNTWEKGLTYAYRDRRNKKRNFRSLWIQRINAAARLGYELFCPDGQTHQGRYRDQPQGARRSGHEQSRGFQGHRGKGKVKHPTQTIKPQFPKGVAAFVCHYRSGATSTFFSGSRRRCGRRILLWRRRGGSCSIRRCGGRRHNCMRPSRSPSSRESPHR